MKIRQVFEDDERILAGVTMVDTSVLPWPGATFSTANGVSEEHVRKSLELLSEHTGVAVENIYTLHQIHSTIVHVIPNEENVTQAPLQGDILVTNKPGILIGVKIADCAAVLLWNADTNTVAAVHSGWRGTATNAVGKALRQLGSGAVKAVGQWGSEAVFGIKAWISPHASGMNYEVGEEVQNVMPDFCTPVRGKAGKWLFDNAKAISAQLVEVGVLEENIVVDPSCTLEDTRFHSHRRDKEKAGRSIAFIGIK